MHFILILGKAGDNGNLSYYDKDDGLNLDLKSGEFYNSTHCILDSFKDSANEFSFISTEEAFKSNKNLLSDFNEIFIKFEPKKFIMDNELSDIFSQISQIIENSKSENIVLDITHGFRHQPIMASFASVLGRVNSRKNIQIIFAKALQDRNYYQYVSLDKYIEISLVAIALNSFVSNLTVPEVPINSEFVRDFIKKLDKFTNALHSNAMKQMFEYLDKILSEFEFIEREFSALDSILKETKRILEFFANTRNAKTNYEQRYQIAKFMHEKEYYLISATWISEALRVYLIEKFEKAGFLNDRKNIENYDKIKTIKNFIFNKKNKYFEDKEQILINIESLNKRKMQKMTDFNALQTLIIRTQNIRNELAHVNEYIDKNLNEIAQGIKSILIKFEKICLKNDCLKDL